MFSAQQLSLMLSGTNTIGEGTPIIIYCKNHMYDRFYLTDRDPDINERNVRVVCRQLGFGGLYTQQNTHHVLLICMIIMYWQYHVHNQSVFGLIDVQQKMISLYGHVYIGMYVCMYVCTCMYVFMYVCM